MTLAQKKRFGAGQPRKTRRFSLPIGLRLSLSFLAVILLTGLIGVLSIQQFSSLSNTTTELNAHDLPEAISVVQLRFLLYRQRDLEHSLLYGGDSSQAQLPLPATATPDEQSKQAQQTLSDLGVVLQEIARERQQMLAYERLNQGSAARDIALVQRVADGVLKTNSVSERIQALIKQGQFAQARALELSQMEPLWLVTVADVTQLGMIEQAETAGDAAQAQLESGRSSFLVFALTALGLLLSIGLAIIITRSLTRPLKALLHTTELIAAGDLNAQSEVESADEIGRLASAYDKMRLNLRSTIASLSQERQQTQAIIDATADGIMLVDAHQKIVKCNPAAEYLSGWRSNEASGRFCWEALGFKETSLKEAEANKQILPLIEALQTRSEQSYVEMPITSRNGQQRWLAISCAPMPFDEGGPEYSVIGLHDISHLKAVDQIKSDFVAMVSHELRAPLTTVAGSVEMLSLLDPAADTESYHEVVDILGQQTGRLRQVVEEVLQLTRFEAGHLEAHLQPLSIPRFLHSLAENINAEWASSDYRVILHEAPQDILVWADDTLLEIVLRNLFENARKYTPQGMAVEVETEIIASTGQARIRVIDHGPGIPADQLERIFERFSRGAQSADSWTRGYGLGLYIARELMQAHNGSIRAENREPGACFELSLWMVTGDAGAIPVEAAPPDRAEKRERGHAR